jgi:nitrate/nitrite-specific signal transduction histidine kinase
LFNVNKQADTTLLIAQKHNKLKWLGPFPVSITLIGGFSILVVLSFVASFSAQWTAKEIYGDALAVNLSGSLRMQSYRIANAIHNGEDSAGLKVLTHEFQERLLSKELKDYIQQESLVLDNHFSKVFERWQVMEHFALNTPNLYLDQVDDFVADIDQLVLNIQQWSEQKISWLRALQGTLLALTVTSAIAFSLLILLRFIRPMVSLHTVISHIQRGQLETRSTYTKADEFGDLSTAINGLANDLIEANQKLSERLDASNKELAVNYNALEFLFRLSQSLAVKDPNLDLLKMQTRDELALQFETENIHWLADHNGCIHDKAGCFIAGNDVQFSLAYCSDVQLKNWQKYTMTTICELFENTNQMLLSQYNSNRIALMNERNSLARELHDSLAQSLSFLKMQVSRWQKLQQRKEYDALDKVVLEIKEGLADSYQSLRELLVTFRTQLDQPGLVPALETAIDIINRSNNIVIDLNCDPTWPEKLAAFQEINCLHIVREALTNVAKHSEAKHAQVNLSGLDNNLIIDIMDDGIGFDTSTRKESHYGLEIMQERANELNGDIIFSKRDSGGMSISLHFPKTNAGAV